MTGTGATLRIAALLFLLLGVLTDAALAETRYVQGRTAKLRSGKTSLDQVVAELKMGDPLEVVRREGPWVEVRTTGGVRGWLPISNTTTVKPSGGDDDLARGEQFPQTDTSEVTGTAGGRGFGGGSGQSPDSLAPPRSPVKPWGR